MKLPELETQKYITEDQLSNWIYEQIVGNPDYNKVLINKYASVWSAKVSDYIKNDIWDVIRTHVFYDEVNNGAMLDTFEADEDKIKDLSNGSNEDKFSAIALTLYNQLVKAVNDSEPEGFCIWVYW